MQIKKNNSIVFIIRIAFFITLLCIMGACVNAVLRKQAMYELFGVVAFLTVTVGIILGYVCEIGSTIGRKK